MSVVEKIIKHGTNPLMVCGYINTFELGLICKVEHMMNQHTYLQILKSNLYQMIAKFNSNMAISQHDYDSEHIINRVKEWLLEQPFGTLKKPTQFPNFNPIKHL